MPSLNVVSSPAPRVGLSVRAQLALLLLAALLPALLALAAYLSESPRVMVAGLWFGLAMVPLGMGMAWRLGERLTRSMPQVAASQASNDLPQARDEAQRQPPFSQAQALELLEHAPAGVLVHGADGAVLSCNPVARAMLGLSTEQLTGKLPADPLWNWCRSDGTPMPAEEHPVLRVLADGETVRDLEIGVCRPEGGDPLWLLCSARPIHDASGRIKQVVLVLLDISERHRAQDQRQRAQERLELILRGMDEAPWDWDLLSGEVYFAPRWWQMLGYEVDELPAQASLWAGLCHRDDVPTFDATLSAALQGNAESCQWEYRLRHKRGHYVPVLTRAYIRRDSQGKAVRMSGVNADLTESRQTQARLQESEGRYRALVEWSPIGIGVHQHGMVVYANPAALRMLGADSLQQLVGTPMVERVHPDFRQPVLERIGHTLSTLDPMPWREEKLLRLDGVAIDVEIQGTLITHLGEPAIQVSMVDITERKKAQAVLRQSEARLRALTELSSDWFWEQDAQLRYVHISAQFQDISGLTPSNYLGLKRWETVHRGVNDAQWAAHRAVLQAQETFFDFEMQHPGRDGDWVWVSISGVPIVDERGQSAGYWGVGRDITERKQAEQLLQDSQSQYQALVEWSPLGMSVHQDGKIVYVNPAAMRLWGAASDDELVGTPIEARFHPQFKASAL